MRPVCLHSDTRDLAKASKDRWSLKYEKKSVLKHRLDQAEAGSSLNQTPFKIPFELCFFQYFTAF